MEPIRILHVVTYMGRGGLETMIMNYYRHMNRSLVQFDFLVHRDFRADYDDEIEALGGAIYRLPQLVPWSATYRTALNTFFAEHPEYRVVHVHQDCLSSIILKAAAQNGVPVRIAHSHNANQDKNLKYPVKLWYRRSIPRYATELFACGKDAGDWMFRGAPYKIINNAIDTATYAMSSKTRECVRRSLGLTDEFAVGHVGRFAPQKNHAFLLDAFAALVKYEPHAVLLLVGDGMEKEKIHQKAMALGLSERIRFLGVRSDVAELMQAMDVFAFPSLYEGLGIVLVEAQAAGLPCVLSDTIPSDAHLTDLVRVVPLSSGAETWAQVLLDTRTLPRTDHRAEIAAHGFDITAEAKKLQEFYLHVYEK